MDYYIRQKTKKEFAQHIRGILRQRLGIVHQIYNYVFEQFGETKNFIPQHLLSTVRNNTQELYPDCI